MSFAPLDPVTIDLRDETGATPKAGRVLVAAVPKPHPGAWFCPPIGWIKAEEEDDRNVYFWKIADGNEGQTTTFQPASF